MDDGDSDDDSSVYVPVRERRRQRQQQLAAAGQTAALAREKRARPAEGTDEAGRPKKRSLLD